MACNQMHKTSEVVCTDKGYGHDHHNMMTCQTTCHGTTGTQTHYGAKPHQPHVISGATGQVHGYNGVDQVHGYGGGHCGAGQVHGYGHGGATQVHGYGNGGQYQGASGAGTGCYGKPGSGGGYMHKITEQTEKVKNMFRRKHKSGNGGNTSCSSDSESDDECHRHRPHC